MEKSGGSRMGSLVRRCAFVAATCGLLVPLAVVAAAHRCRDSTVINCHDSGAGSLRNAITTAASGESIGFTPGLNCTSGGLGPITLTSTLTIGTNLTIDGTGATIVVDGGCMANCGTVSAVGGVTVFRVNSSVAASITRLTIRNGTGSTGTPGTTGARASPEILAVPAATESPAAPVGSAARAGS